MSSYLLGLFQLNTEIRIDKISTSTFFTNYLCKPQRRSCWWQAHLVHDQPKRTHLLQYFVSFLSSHGCADQIQVTNATCRVTAQSPPNYPNLELEAHVPSLPLCSSEEYNLFLPSLHKAVSVLRLFVFQRWWNEQITLCTLKTDLKIHLLQEPCFKSFESI